MGLVESSFGLRLASSLPAKVVISLEKDFIIKQKEFNQRNALAIQSFHGVAQH